MPKNDATVNIKNNAYEISEKNKIDAWTFRGGSKTLYVIISFMLNKVTFLGASKINIKNTEIYVLRLQKRKFILYNRIDQ